MNFHHLIRFDPESLGLLRVINSKLDHITERLRHMATDGQVAQLKSDIATMINEYMQAVTDLIAKAQTQSQDPAIDALDQSVRDATAALHAKLTGPVPGVPATPPTVPTPPLSNEKPLDTGLPVTQPVTQPAP